MSISETSPRGRAQGVHSAAKQAPRAYRRPQVDKWAARPSNRCPRQSAAFAMRFPANDFEAAPRNPQVGFPARPVRPFRASALAASSPARFPARPMRCRPDPEVPRAFRSRGSQRLALNDFANRAPFAECPAPGSSRRAPRGPDPPSNRPKALRAGSCAGRCRRNARGSDQNRGQPIASLRTQRCWSEAPHPLDARWRRTRSRASKAREQRRAPRLRSLSGPLAQPIGRGAEKS